MSRVLVSDWFIKDMQLIDLAAVAAIESEAQISPWSRDSFEDSLRQGHSCRCLWLADRLVAYSVSHVIVDELHILNVVVMPSMQGEGLAHALMHELFDTAASAQVEKLFLEVRESNVKAQGLYEKWGFKLLSVRKQYYQTSVAKLREDALIYHRTLEN